MSLLYWLFERDLPFAQRVDRLVCSQQKWTGCDTLSVAQVLAIGYCVMYVLLVVVRGISYFVHPGILPAINFVASGVALFAFCAATYANHMELKSLRRTALVTGQPAINPFRRRIFGFVVLPRACVEILLVVWLSYAVVASNAFGFGDALQVFLLSVGLLWSWVTCADVWPPAADKHTSTARPRTRASVNA